MFGRATITLGIGPHSSSTMACPLTISQHSGTGYDEIAAFVPCQFQSRFQAQWNIPLSEHSNTDRQPNSTETALLSSWVKVLRPIKHRVGYFRDVLPSQSPDLVLKKLNLTQQKQTTQEQNGIN